VPVGGGLLRFTAVAGNPSTGRLRQGCTAPNRNGAWSVVERRLQLPPTLVIEV
jgi:hypothetical protein